MRNIGGTGTAAIKEKVTHKQIVWYGH